MPPASTSWSAKTARCWSSGERPARPSSATANPAFLEELRTARIPFVAGESVVEADAQWAAPILDGIDCSSSR